MVVLVTNSFEKIPFFNHNQIFSIINQKFASLYRHKHTPRCCCLLFRNPPWACVRVCCAVKERHMHTNKWKTQWLINVYTTLWNLTGGFAMKILISISIIKLVNGFCLSVRLPPHPFHGLFAIPCFYVLSRLTLYSLKV